MVPRNVLVFLYFVYINSLSVNLTKWSKALEQFVGNWPTNCLSVFDHFVGLFASFYFTGVHFRGEFHIEFGPIIV